MELAWHWNMTANPIYWRLFIFPIGPDSIFKSSMLGTNQELLQDDNSESKNFTNILIQWRLSVIKDTWFGCFRLFLSSCCPQKPLPQKPLCPHHNKQHDSVSNSEVECPEEHGHPSLWEWSCTLTWIHVCPFTATISSLNTVSCLRKPKVSHLTLERVKDITLRC